MINIRKLAAVDIYIHGRVFVLIEFGVAVLLLGVSSVRQILREFSTHASAPLTHWYFASVAVNYIPLLVYAVAIAKKNSARADISADLVKGRKGLQKYSFQQLWLVVPFLVPIAALFQEIDKRLPKRSKDED